MNLRLLRIRPYAVATGQLIGIVHGTLFLRQAMHLPPLTTGLALPPRSYPWQVPGTVLAGIGMGIQVPALSAELMRAVPRQDRADASVLRQTIRQL
ncbi:hypothetical protein ABZ766_14630 [Streptomyces sp. NPDC006670]|uniref:hypothetical protein n=1 Tax=Streptomyces sp. NPDC006670 TaxID=3154476 RepID=UPI0034115205